MQTTSRTQLKPHQKEAVKAILNEFIRKKETRTKYIAPCGSGKTLVGLHVAEALDPKSAIIFLPSLALIRQTLIEWSKENMFRGLYTPLFVCSDKTLTEGTDESIVTEKDLGHSITTEPSTVRRFLQKPCIGVKIIFSTYQSAKIIAAGMPKYFCFDFGILDEAHRTAGRAGKPFGVVLNDERIPIRRRLSMTATPRHFKIRRSFSENTVLAYSMDSYEQYGSLGAHLTFRDAVEQDLICDNKILFSAITTSDIDEDLLEKKIVIKRQTLDAQRIANLIAIQNAVKKHGIKKIFTFHGRVEEARDFIEATNPRLSIYLPGFKYFHINGSMPTEKREAILADFKNAERAIISNARCLSEGVDVPATECIVFMCPKKSTVDIVQAVGRASRKHGNKSHGVVLLPVFANQNKKESPEEAIERTGYSYVWQVLNALVEQDEALDLIIQNATMGLGLGRETNFTELKAKVEVMGSNHTLSAMSKAITTKILETTGETFYFWFGLLQAYYTEMGHAHIPEGCLYRGKYRLGRWASSQRHKFRKGQLKESYRKALESVRFEFDPIKADFNEKLDLLKAYLKKHGHFRISNDPVNKKLKQFVAGLRNRAERRLDIFSNEQLKELDDLQFEWHPRSTAHQHHFSQLEAFKKKYGHCEAGESSKSEYPGLQSWVYRMRLFWKNQTLDPDDENRLVKMGFDFDPIASKFEEGFAALSKFIQNHGHTKIPRNITFGHLGYSLSGWTARIRADHKKNRLGKEAITRLEGIGFDWAPKTNKIEKWFELLVQYKNKYGHCRVPGDFKLNGKRLGYWVCTVRIARRTGLRINLTENFIRKLDKLGFVWDPLKDDFEEKFGLLVQYKNEYGHLNVGYDETYGGVNLGVSVKTLREAKKHGRSAILTPDRIKRLDELGFIWIKPKTKVKYSSSKRFADFDCNIALFIEIRRAQAKPVSPQNPVYKGVNLWAWIKKIRRLHRYLELPEKLIKQLEDSGITWSVKQGNFDKYLTLLETFIKLEGHSKVPFKWIADGYRLGAYVSALRIKHKNGQLPNTQITQLNRIGFQFENKVEDGFSQWVELLREFKNHYGHVQVPTPFIYKDKRLGQWLANVRRSNKRSRLNPTRAAILESMGVKWNWNNNERGNQRLFLLETFFKLHGHIQVSEINGLNFETWFSWLRKRYRKGLLSQDLVHRLDALQFKWHPRDEFFEKGLKCLTDYKTQFGHLQVPEGFKMNGFALSRWIHNIRGQSVQNALTSDQLHRLQKIGLSFNPCCDAFENRFQQLATFKKVHGHCRVNKRNKKVDHTLRWWVPALRDAKRNGSLPFEYIKRLDEIGFDWDPHLSNFDLRMKDLMSFRNIHGHLNVPASSKQWRLLWLWLARLRRRYREGGLRPALVERLEAAGMVWNPQDERFKVKLEALKHFKDKNGHCDIPTGSHGKLGEYVVALRLQKQKGTLTQPQIEQLNGIGFQWIAINRRIRTTESGGVEKK